MDIPKIEIDRLRRENAELLEAVREVKLWLDGEDNEFQETVEKALANAEEDFFGDKQIREDEK